MLLCEVVAYSIEGLEIANTFQHSRRYVPPAVPALLGHDRHFCAFLLGLRRTDAHREPLSTPKNVTVGDTPIIQQPVSVDDDELHETTVVRCPTYSYGDAESRAFP